jgi:2-methylisocitrate lyase-like PEP mutase family enzyme
MSAAAQLRARLEGPTLLVPGAYNPLVARIFERHGFEALYAGGYAAAAATYGLPDIGLMTQSEMAQHVARIAGSVDVPVIADADTGYGDLVNVARTVREFERAGAAAVQIEDQTFPKRCGHLEGKQVIPRDEMVRKVQTALRARRNPETVIIARTDAIAVTGLADAIERMQAYEEAGADVIFPDAPTSLEDLRTIVAAVDKPLLANMSEHGKTPLLDLATLRELGYAIALFPSSSLFAAARSAHEVAEALASAGTTAGILERLEPFGDLNELLDLSRWQREEEQAL